MRSNSIGFGFRRMGTSISLIGTGSVCPHEEEAG